MIAVNKANIFSLPDILLIVTIAQPVYYQTNRSYTLTCSILHYGGHPSSIEWTLPNGTVITGGDSDGTYQISETSGEAVDESKMIMLGEYYIGNYSCTGRTSKDTWSETIDVPRGMYTL